MYDKIERIHKEGGGEKKEEGSKGDINGGDDDAGGERRGRGTHPWRTPPTTTILTAPSPLDRVLLILTPNLPRMTMTKRSAWWEYLCSGYAQWNTWRL